MTNFASIAGLDLRRDFGRLIAGEFPISFLTTFLHEMTHHWCFNSPVGNALAMLRYATVRDALTRREDDADALWDLLDLIIRFESANGVLRPLSEGLALFAEFDLRPGNEELITQPLGWVYAFAEDKPRDPDEFSAALLNTIIASRFRNDCYERKANLITQRMNTADGGYLSGYMLVKRLRLHLLGRSRRFEDADFFLGYLRSYFYEDLGLVAAIFDASVSEVEAYGRIFERFQMRLHLLLDTEDLEPHLVDYEADVLANGRLRVDPDTDSSTARHGILMTDVDIVGGLNALNERVRPPAVDPEQSLDSVLDHFDTLFLRRRHILCLARETVSVECRVDGGKVFCGKDGASLTAIPGLANTKRFKGDGIIAFLVYGDLNQWAVSVTFNQRVVALKLSSELPPRERQWLESYATDDATYDLAIDTIDALFKSILEATSPAALLEIILGKIDHDVNWLYREMILANVEPDKRSLTESALDQKGLWNLLGADLEKTKAYAIVGLCTALNLVRREKVEDLVAASGFSVANLLSTLVRTEAHFGLRLHDLSENALVGRF